MQLVELRYQDPATKTYLGSPSIIRLPNRDLLATHDYFGPGCPRNKEGEEHLTSLYRSSDDGCHWHNVTHIANAFWSSLFTLGDEVYLMGTSQQYGSIVIRRSTDNGLTWTHPENERSGLLFRGGPGRKPPNYHCAPVPILIQHDKIYRAFEDNITDNWPAGFRALVLSADIDADLLDASSWTMSNKLPFDAAWLQKVWGPASSAGWLEGNVVADRQGHLWNVLRVNAKHSPDSQWSLWNKAAMVRITHEGRQLTFDPGSDFIDLPGAHSKFTIRRDPLTGSYLTLSNGVADSTEPTNRSMLSLYQSPDLRRWQHCTTLLQEDTGLLTKHAAQQVGFQYVDWQFDGKDIIYLVRTAYRGAHNYHDANRITFHRIRDFQQQI